MTLLETDNAQQLQVPLNFITATMCVETDTYIQVFYYFILKKVYYYSMCSCLSVYSKVPLHIIAYVAFD